MKLINFIEMLNIRINLTVLIYILFPSLMFMVKSHNLLTDLIILPFDNIANPACGWSHIACDPYTNEITKINLSNQHLKLTLASELSQLTSLTELNLEANQVSGTIPSFLFESFEKLEYLVLAKNDLQSTIPPLTESLKNLRVFDISDNRLRGEIPEDIGDVLGQNLEKLDLSHNGLTGDIPKSITKCKNLGFLDLSTNLLDGMYNYQ